MIAPRPAVRGRSEFPLFGREGLVHFLVERIGGEMKIIIDKDKCKGHNNCISIAPNVFEVDEKFKAFVLDPKGDSDEDILKAARACPELAIILEDETSGKQIFPGPDDKPRNQLGGSKWGG
jgi:ferredoxin